MLHSNKCFPWRKSSLFYAFMIGARKWRIDWRRLKIAISVSVSDCVKRHLLPAASVMATSCLLFWLQRVRSTSKLLRCSTWHCEIYMDIYVVVICSTTRSIKHQYLICDTLPTGRQKVSKTPLHPAQTCAARLVRRICSASTATAALAFGNDAFLL